MDAWIFIAALTLVSMAPFMSRYDNPDAEWADAQNDEIAADRAPELRSDSEET